MIKVQRKNVIYQIDESKLQEFLDMGYRQLDSDGHMMPTEADMKKSAYDNRVKELEAELAEAKAVTISDGDKIILTKFHELLALDKITKAATHEVAEEIVSLLTAEEDSIEE